MDVKGGRNAQPTLPLAYALGMPAGEKELLQPTLPLAYALGVSAVQRGKSEVHSVCSKHEISETCCALTRPAYGREGRV